MKKIKYNLKELMADAEKDETASKPIRQLVSQDVISEMLKKAKNSGKEAKQHGN